MSRSGSILAICAVAGLVGLVAAQQWDPMQCSRNLRESVSKYSEGMTGMVRDFANNMRDHGSSAIDMNGFTSDANKLVDQMSSLTNTEGGFDASRYLSAYYEIVRTQISMSRHFLNPRVGLNAFREYLSFSNKMMSANSDFLAQIGTQCMPQNGRGGSN